MGRRTKHNVNCQGPYGLNLWLVSQGQQRMYALSCKVSNPIPLQRKPQQQIKHSIHQSSPKKTKSCYGMSATGSTPMYKARARSSSRVGQGWTKTSSWARAVVILPWPKAWWKSWPQRGGQLRMSLIESTRWEIYEFCDLWMGDGSAVHLTWAQVLLGAWEGWIRDIIGWINSLVWKESVCIR